MTRHRRQVYRLQQIRRILEDLREQIRYLQVCVRYCAKSFRHCLDKSCRNFTIPENILDGKREDIRDSVAH